MNFKGAILLTLAFSLIQSMQIVHQSHKRQSIKHGVSVKKRGSAHHSHAHQSHAQNSHAQHSQAHLSKKASKLSHVSSRLSRRASGLSKKAS